MHTHIYIYIYILFSPLPLSLSTFPYFIFSFVSHSFPLLFLFKYFSLVFPSNEHSFCTTMVHYMYHLALFVVPFNTPKPTQCCRQISSKRSTNTVLELLIFMQRKATFSVVMSPCTSVRPSASKNSAPTGRNFHEI
jgi:hypothetical protein